MGKLQNKNPFSSLVIIPVLIILATLRADEFPADASKLNISIKVHKIGPGGIISNLGYMGKPVGFEIENLNKMLGKPPDAQLALTTGGRNALHLLGIVNRRKVYTSGEEWSDQSDFWGYEFFPSGEPWDSIWVVYRGEEVDIPYLPGYVGISDEDFVLRYDDYHVDIPDQQNSLNVEVIHISHSWGVPSYNTWQYHQFYIIPKVTAIRDFYFAWSSFGGIGKQPSNPNDWVNIGMDDISYFDNDLKMAFKEDQEGHDADGFGPAGFKIWVPDGYDENALTWSFNNTVMPNHNDEQWYNILSSGVQDKPNYAGTMPEKIYMTMACGPFNLDVGDTLLFRVVNVPGQDRQDLLDNLRRLESLIEKGFVLPTAPPAPPLRITAGNHQALLSWRAEAGEEDPVTWVDPNRPDVDVEPQPFEGFTIHKSFNKNGPWTLLAQYDIKGNGIGAETGLEFEYLDVGLLNNFKYYYAVSAYTKPDQITNAPPLSSALQLSVAEVIPGTQVEETVGNVFVVPNPYRGDQSYSAYNPPWEQPSQLQNILQQNQNNNIFRWTETDRRLQFVNVPSPARIKIYSLAGDLIRVLDHDNPLEGIVDWNLTSDQGLTIASGIYLYAVIDRKNGKTQVGRFVVIK